MASFTKANLKNGGKTAHYQVEYDEALNKAVGEGAAEALIAGCESDFNLMTKWFGGIASPWSGRMTVRIQAGNTSNGGTGAEWPNLGGPVTLIPGLAANSASASVSEWFVRYLLVSEVVEMFMDKQGKGWYGGTWHGGGNEGSAGEGLSRFLGTQFLLLEGQSLSLITGYNIAFTWLESSGREDFVNHVNPSQNGFFPECGCAVLFIYYLFTQLGFSIEQIVGAGADQLGGVYENLTGDASDPFPFFKQMLDVAFPGTSTITTGNLDDPYPLGSLSFIGVKNTYGRDEVTNVVDDSSGRYKHAFWVALEGFNRQVVGSTVPSEPTIAFAGTTAAPNAQGIEYQSTNQFVPQRISFPYDVLFTSESEGAFPSAGLTPAEVNTEITVLGKQLPAKTEFFFTAGADPYFTNVLAGATQGDENEWWLSQDLRVFSATPAQDQFPVTGGPQFSVDSFQGAYSYLEALLGFLNGAYGDPSGGDPFATGSSIFPGQAGAYTGDSSVTPFTVDISHLPEIKIENNYNFAIARVRLRGSKGSAGKAEGVKVFFRLWGTQTADTDWDPSSTYLSHEDSGGNPVWPEAPSDSHTIPFFATGNAPNFNDPSNPEYGTSGINNKTIEIQQGEEQWTYFGCFLNVYDPSFSVNGKQVQEHLPGDHHCLVAQIAYSGDPIQDANGITMSPEISDMLAQRNLQVTTSDNPGSPATHRVPQTFDVRPSPRLAPSPDAVPDELMIDWGSIPTGSIATIYWPQVSAAEVLALSSWMYGTQQLTEAEVNTIQCVTSSNLTFVPIPATAAAGFGGLLTVQLPAGLVKGEEFNVLVRRISTRSVQLPPPPPIIGIGSAPATHVVSSLTARKGEETEGGITERYVVGTFQIRVPVSDRNNMLAAEETRLAIFKARLETWPVNDRWYPVLVRYLELLTERVDGLGGNANEIPPSLGGYPPGGIEHRPGRPERGGELVGKVCEVLFDCFGDFEGFILCSCEREHRIPAREPALRELVLRACKERLELLVVMEDARIREVRVLCGCCPRPHWRERDRELAVKDKEIRAHLLERGGGRSR